VHDIETALAALGATPGGGVAASDESFMGAHVGDIIAFAERFRLPAIYPFRSATAKGGLISYGPDGLDLFRRAASYVDRILKGAKPADLPVQLPTKFVLVINTKTAETLGLAVPRSLLTIADEVIE
jgi:putative tryptophan/tyrosine transport system substrate-binding protein